MLSPFPGMDPYLERPALWAGFHAGLIAVLREMLAGQVAPRFFVDSEDHVYIIAPDDPARRPIQPDLALVERELVLAGPGTPRGQISAPTVLTWPEPVEVRYSYLVIRDTTDNQVVAVLEVLSPVNKTAGSAGLTDFQRKRSDVFQSTAHWIEIDLLRAGVRPPELHGYRFPYYALLHRAGARTLEAWFATVRTVLPTIPVPLLPSLPDVPLDLQEAIETVYQRYRYDTGLDYNLPPPAPPLSAADAAWAAERIRAWRTE